MNEFTVVIKTFMRPKTCENLVSLWRNLYGNELKIIVVDDGKLNPNFRDQKNTRHEKIPFDSGVSLGRNIGVSLADTELVFISDDDNTPPSPESMQKCMDILLNHDIDIIGCGAFGISIQDGFAVIRRRKISGEFAICEATLQHFLAKKSRMPMWNESLKITGEHFDYFMRCAEQKVRVAGTDILGFKRIVMESKEDMRDYNKYRWRRNFQNEACKIWGVVGEKWIR